MPDRMIPSTSVRWSRTANIIESKDVMSFATLTRLLVEPIRTVSSGLAVTMILMVSRVKSTLPSSRILKKQD